MIWASLQACGVVYGWRREYRGLKLGQAKALKQLEKENSKLKRLVAELSLENRGAVGD